MTPTMAHTQEYPRFLRRFARAEDGATIVEFGLVSFLFFMLMFMVFEIGLYTYTQVAVEGALQQAARTASIGNTGAAQGYTDRVSYVTETTKKKLASLPNGGFIAVTSNVVTVPGAAATKAQDMCIDPGNPNADPYPTQCTCTGCMVMNNDGMCTTPNCYDGPNNNLGTAGQLVEIRATFGWKILFPIVGQFLRSDNSPNANDEYQASNNYMRLITTSVILKNEPFQ